MNLESGGLESCDCSRLASASSPALRCIFERENCPKALLALTVFPSAASARSFLYPGSFWMLAQTWSSHRSTGLV